MIKKKRTVNFLLNGEIADTTEIDMYICEECGTVSGFNGYDSSDIMNRVFMIDHGWADKLADHLDDTIQVVLAKE